MAAQGSTSAEGTKDCPGRGNGENYGNYENDVKTMCRRFCADTRKTTKPTK